MTGPRPTVLPRELADLLIELSIALHKHAMYPEGHPSLGPAAQGVIRRLDTCMQDRASLSLGIARNQLVIEGVATDSKNPVLKELAGRLHRHHLGAITFRRGLLANELRDVLQAVSQEADRAGPLGLGPTERLAAWPHARLYPLSYDRLKLSDDDPQATAQSESKTRAVQLWLGLAQAALAAQAPPDEQDSSKTDPGAIAKAIETHKPDTAYDQVIVGYLLQIADELKRGGGDAAALQRRLSELVSQLDSGTLDRLLEMGGDLVQRRRFLLDASDTLAVEAVLDLAQAAGRTEHKAISQALLRMLQKLGHQAAAGAGRRRVLADQSVREQVARMIRGWALEDPNPREYGVALMRMANTAPAETRDARAQHEAEPHRLLQMGLELNVTGLVVERAVSELVARGQLESLAETLKAAGSATAETIWRQLAHADVIRTIVTAEPLDARQLDMLLPRVGIAAAEPMLDALATSESSQARRVLLDRLIAFGSVVGPLVVQRLQDASWFVQRNMLAILSDLPERPADFDPKPFLEHPDARVRREALRLLLRNDDTRERAIHYALADPDQRAMRLGLATAVQHGLPESAVPLAASLALGAEAQDLRVSAIRALGKARGTAAVDALIRLVTPKKKGLFRRKVARTPEIEAAASALQTFAEQPRVRQVLAELSDA